MTEVNTWPMTFVTYDISSIVMNFQVNFLFNLFVFYLIHRMIAGYITIVLPNFDYR